MFSTGHPYPTLRFPRAVLVSRFLAPPPRLGRYLARRLCRLGCAWGFAGSACTGPARGPDDSNDPNPASSAPSISAAPRPAGVADEGDPPGAVSGPVAKGSMREHPQKQAWVFADGKQGPVLDVGVAEARGYTVLDLSDTWVPYIFSGKTEGREDGSPNIYAERYVGLANDLTDSDGDRLPGHRHNYLELYGIPPTLTVLAREWERVESHVQPCLNAAGYDPAIVAQQRGTLAFERSGAKRRVRKHRRLRKALDKSMAKARLSHDDHETAAVHPKTKRAFAAWEAVNRDVVFIEQAQIRFRCEKLFKSNGGEGNAKPGAYDGATHHALAAFEKKHNLRGWGHFSTPNVAVLAQSAVDSTHARLVRFVRERTVSATAVVEDGTALRGREDFVYKDVSGAEHKLRDMAAEVSVAALAALGLTTVAEARAQVDLLLGLMERDEATELGRLLVAVRLPAMPPYHGPDMAFDVVINRGDVWYEFPYDQEGNKLPQSRRYKPRLTVYTTYLEQRIPLVRWRTTIGSWRSEQHDGREWFAYKNSDVGKRVWKDIVAAPVWVPPASTPVRSLLKRKYRRKQLRYVVNYDETGPSYMSAYGLVAAYHIKQVFDDEGNVRAELDNQIRTHGSVDYMSILRRYSHGCHRLYNMNAVRLFSFILGHREYVRHGQTRMGFRRLFEFEGEEHKISLDTRGYRYELPEPIEVVVTKGRIRGSRKTRYKELMPKPGEDYSEDEGSTGEIDEGETSGPDRSHFDEL